MSVCLCVCVSEVGSVGAGTRSVMQATFVLNLMLMLFARDSNMQGYRARLLVYQE